MKKQFSPRIYQHKLKTLRISGMTKNVNTESKFSVKKQKVILQSPTFCTPLDLLKYSCYPSTFPKKIFLQNYNQNLNPPCILGNSLHLLPDHKTPGDLQRAGKIQVKVEHLKSQITGTEGEFRNFLLHPLSHRDRDNHSTHR